MKFAGKKKTTDSHGVAVFSVAKHHAKGKFPIVVTRSGYQQATTSVRIH